MIKWQELLVCGYPGGPKVDKLAKEGKPIINLPKTHFENFDFSFSGIKTSIINLYHKQPDLNKADLCASFEKTVTEMLLDNTKRAAKQCNTEKIALAGGVSANSYIRNEFLKFGEASKKYIYYPEPILCTDNAAMIAASAYYHYIIDDVSDLTLNAVPNLRID